MHAPEQYAASHAAGYSLVAKLQPGPMADSVVVHLLYGTGVFANGMPTSFPATYSLSGAESEYATCGACVVLFPDVTNLQPTGNPYVARGGMLTIDQVEPILVMRLANLTFERVAADIEPRPLVDPTTKSGTTSKADESGCHTTLSSLQLAASAVGI